MARIIATYALLGPIVGALLYIALSALAGALGIHSNVFIDAALLSSARETLGLAGWQIALSAPFSLAPAILTGWLTARRMARTGNCPWWLSCLWGGLISGIGGFIALAAAKAGYPDLPIIPNPLPGAALIAFIGFVGTWPCWRLVGPR
jgi:hypothetical protein